MQFTHLVCLFACFPLLFYYQNFLTLISSMLGPQKVIHSEKPYLGSYFVYNFRSYCFSMFGN